MSRTIDQILTAMKVTVRTYPSLNAFKFPEDGGSQVSLFNLTLYTVAAGMFVFETLVDNLQGTIQAIADTAVSGNLQWVQRQILNFQYGDVIQLVNFVPTYTPVDLTHRIITQCSVVEGSSNTLDIKVAKGTSPSLTPLSGPELSALEDYWYGTATTEGVGFAGVSANFISLNPDRIGLVATVYYFGQYDPVALKTAVIAAIDNFFATFSGVAFNGTIFMSKLKSVVEDVPGVSRCTFASATGRAATVLYASAIPIDVQGIYLTLAGYLISEDTAAHTLNDSITMTLETA